MFCACRESETISKMSGRQKSYINIPTLWVLSVVAALAVAWSVMYIFTLPMGDDLIYTSILRRADGIGTGAYAVWEFPRYWGAPLDVHQRPFGQPVCVALHGHPPALDGVGDVRYGCRGHVPFRALLLSPVPLQGERMAATVVIAVIAFLFPWWDSFRSLM